MRIDHINFNVSNLNNSVSFYTELFGFTVKENGVSNGSGAPYKIIGLIQSQLIFKVLMVKK